MPDGGTTTRRVLGVDVGGTFTDFLLWDGDSIRVHKRPSTPDDPSRSVLEGLDELGLAASETPALVVHGTTVATNTVLERRGARTALVTTEGMRDLLVIGRQTRPDIYALEPESPEPIVAAELTFELRARLTPAGEVGVEAAPGEAAELVRRALEGGAESLAVSLLYSYANPALERLFSEPAAERGLYLSLSSQVSPEYREVERTATTALNSYVGPLMGRYLEGLARGLARRGSPRLHIVQSDGGAAGVQRASRLPVATLLSGPAAGVSGAVAAARLSGFDRLLTLDMGGTSTDVALCDGGVPTRPDLEIDGLTARTPTVDVHTVGAGGGSIARIDPGGALRVGPHSAGADPGPAAYGRGRDFTVTDAQVVLGRLGSGGGRGRGGGLLGGAMPLDERRARRAVSGLVHHFGGDPHRAAQAVVDVAVANMERALRVVSVQRGRDPREFTLVAFGGAGPLHACTLAEALEVPRVLIPPAPGVLAALGAGAADLTAERARSVLKPLAAHDHALGAALGAALAEVAREVREELAEPGAQVELSRALDLRYRGQSYELTVELADDGALDEPALLGARSRFDALHERRFAHHDPGAPVEVVAVRARARRAGAPLLGGASARAESRGPRQQGPPAVTPCWFDGRRLDTTVIERASLGPGESVEGPAILTQLDTTTLVTPGWSASCDPHGNLLLERTGGAR